MKILHIIKARYPGEAQIRCLRKVMEAGILLKDNDSMIKEILNVVVVIVNPLVEDKIVKDSAELKMIAWMQNNFFSQDAIVGWGYSYCQRLFNYNKIDQVKMVIGRLKDNPASKSATITLMMPGFDTLHVPCLTTVDFKIRNKKLLLTCFARSQDIYKKMYADMLCLAKIQKDVADKLNIKTGLFCLNVVSAHIYKEDFKKAKEALKNIQRR